MAIHRFNNESLDASGHKTWSASCVACGEEAKHANHRTPLGCPACGRTDQLHITFELRNEIECFAMIDVDEKPLRTYDHEIDDAEWEPMDIYCFCGWKQEWDEPEVLYGAMPEVPYVDPEEKAAIEGLRRVLDEVSN